MKILSKLTAVVAGLVLASGVALATTSPNSFYAGFNPQTNGNGFTGAIVAGGPPPTATTSTCSGGTVVVTGGTFAGVAKTTTCTSLVLVLTAANSTLAYSNAPPPTSNSPYFGTQTNSPAPPHGGFCFGHDETNAAAYQGVFALVGSGTYYTGYTCTITATVTGGDTVSYVIILY